MSGIGYFTLPYLVHAGAAKVYACEWNPDAVEALQKNLVSNGVFDRCTIHQGDNRQVRFLYSSHTAYLSCVVETHFFMPPGGYIYSCVYWNSYQQHFIGTSKWFWWADFTINQVKFRSFLGKKHNVVINLLDSHHCWGWVIHICCISVEIYGHLMIM